MTYKVLLAPVSGGGHDSVTLSTAFQVARTFDAHVEVLFSRLSPSDAVPLVGEGMSSTVVEHLMQSAETEWTARSAEAERAYRDALAQNGIDERMFAGQAGPSAHFSDRTGREEDLVSAAGQLSDLIVMCRPSSVTDDLQLTLTLEAALMAAGRPLLLAPAGIPTTVGTTTAVAWRGTTDCARAVAGAMPFLARSERVIVLTAETQRTHPDRGVELVNYLAWQGIEASAQHVVPGDRSVPSVLLEAAGEAGADLLVMGGYGHSRMREMILGGVTRFVLEHAGLPVLMAH